MSENSGFPVETRTSAARGYVEAVAAVNRGDWARAMPLLRSLLDASPDLPHVHYLLSVAALAVGEGEKALTHSHRALELQPDEAGYVLQAARVISQIRSPQQALGVASDAIARVWNDGSLCQQLSAIFARANAYEQAARLSARALELLPGDAATHFNHATTSLFVGDLDAAEKSYQRVLSFAPDHAQAHLGLAQLKKWTREANHIPRLLARLGEARQDVVRMYLHLALAKEYEDVGEFAKAFRHLSTGKAVGRTLSRYDARSETTCFRLLTDGWIDAAGQGDGCPNGEPIFIVGMPRTGTTLVDRILSSHSSVQSIGEVLNFPSLVKRASGSRTRPLIDPDTLQRASGIDWASLGEKYVASTRPLTGHRPRFIDKHPHNFLYIGMIARALPQAKIICLRRPPLDTCLSNFRQLFSPASPYHGYSFDLLDTGRYYLQYQRFMQHAEQRLGGRVLWVEYEELVAAQERETRRILDFCQLEWQEECLRFERNVSPVATASVVQVREKLHGDAMGRWRHYSDELQPLAALLASEGID